MKYIYSKMKFFLMLSLCGLILLPGANVEAAFVKRNFYSAASGQTIRGENDWWQAPGYDEVVWMETHNAAGPEVYGPCLYAVARIGAKHNVYVNYCAPIGWVAAGNYSAPWIDGSWSEHSDRHTGSKWNEIVSSFTRY